MALQVLENIVVSVCEYKGVASFSLSKQQSPQHPLGLRVRPANFVGHVLAVTNPLLVSAGFLTLMTGPGFLLCGACPDFDVTAGDRLITRTEC